MKLKINPYLVLREIAGETVLIPTGELAAAFNGMISLNTVAAVIWKHVEQAESREALKAIILEQFDVDEETADKDVNGFLDTALKAGFLFEQKE